MTGNTGYFTITRMLNFKPEKLPDGERISWLRLIRSENVGPVTFHKLMARYHSASHALDALPELARHGGRQRYKPATKDKAEAELERISKSGAALLAHAEPGYPPLLRMTTDAPPLLNVKGNIHLLEQLTLGIVGARNASANGLGFARRLAADIGRGGFGCQDVIVASGMARGIDTAAHEGAMETGTVAVVAGGVDVVYPTENQTLYDAIAERGVIIAEMPIGTRPTARMFPARNRIISGMSKGVVVVEASPRSGSLITARTALDQGRDVFAVPGAPGDPRARGTNGLIRDGAVLTETAADVLRVIGASPALSSGRQYTLGFGGTPPADSVENDAIERARPKVLELLGPAPLDVDDLLRASGFCVAEVSAVLLELELAGRLERLPGNRISLIIAPD